MIGVRWDSIRSLENDGVRTRPRPVMPAMAQYNLVNSSTIVYHSRVYESSDTYNIIAVLNDI
jgi:hypothetical protein